MMTELSQSETSVSSSDLLAAIELLTKAIGAYHKDKEISIHWGNGIVLRENGIMLRGGMNRVADGIAQIAAKTTEMTSSATQRNDCQGGSSLSGPSNC